MVSEMVMVSDMSMRSWFQICFGGNIFVLTGVELLVYTRAALAIGSSRAQGS